ncbi:MAG: hypothetical protein PHV33_15025, partial [Elusimicrobiales bacterium]|nr:hypothetical protein [Elusimicrobiales bacterium]
YATSTFLMDFSTPTAFILQPGHLTYQQTLGALSGTAADPVAGGGSPSGLKTIWVELADTDRKPQQYWNFNAVPPVWQAAYSSGAITAASNWSVAASSLPNNTADAKSWSVGRSSATFVIKVKAQDRAGNYTDFSLNQSTFTLDLMLPVSKIVSPPAENGFYLVVSSVIGTAADYTSGISSVQVRIQQDPSQAPENTCTDTSINGYYFNGSNWQPGESWQGVNTYDAGTSSWTYNTSAAVFRAYCYYVIRSSASDNMANGEASWGSRRFRFMPPPAATRVNLPENLKYYKSLTIVSGTANPDTKRVGLELRRLSDNWYWDFNSAWQLSLSSVAITPLPDHTWSQSASLPQFLSGSSYTFRSVGISFSEVYEGGPVVNTVYFDTAPPTALVQLPSAAQLYYKSIPKLGGLAQDPPGVTPPASGISRVWAELYAVNGPDISKYWDNATNSFTASWNQAGNQGSYYVAVSSWEYAVSSPAAAYTNGAQYRVRAKSLDNTYNNSTFEGIESDFSDVNLVFNFDVTVPTAVVTSVTPGQRRSGVSAASGTLTEENVLANAIGYQPGMQIQGVKVGIKYNNFNQYWDHVSGWQPSPAVWPAAAVYQSSWSYTNMPAWADDGSYTIWAEATDKAGNVQTNFAGNGSSVTFTVDKAAPALAVLVPAANSKISSVVSLSGTADDPNWLTNSGIAGASNIQAQVSYLLGADTYYYDNAAGFSSSTLNDTNSWYNADVWTPQGPSSGTWLYQPAGLSAAMVPDKVYRFRARAQDNAVPVPNPASLPANVVTNANVIYDVTKPVSRITYPREGLKIKASNWATVTGTAVDNLAGISALSQLGVSIAEVSPAAAHWDGLAGPGTFTATSEVFRQLGEPTLGAAYAGGNW